MLDTRHSSRDHRDYAMRGSGEPPATVCCAILRTREQRSRPSSGCISQHDILVVHLGIFDDVKITATGSPPVLCLTALRPRLFPCTSNCLIGSTLKCIPYI